MEKVIFVVLVLCVMMVLGHKPHPKFPPRVPAEIGSNTIKGPVACSKAHDTEFKTEVDKSKCGEPKEEFITLEPSVKHETVIPSGAWVKRCHGLCDHYNNEGYSCVPIDVQIRHIPVRVYNLETGKESCRHFPVKEHLSCGCCSPDREECPENMVFNPRKCSCQCPNMDERRNCLKNKPFMKWNRSTCTCERRKKFATSKRSTFEEFYDSHKTQRTS